MKRAVIAVVGLAAALLAVEPSQAGSYAASAEANGTVTISGTWSVVTALTGDTAAGMDLWSQTGYVVFDKDAVSAGSASSAITHTYGSGSASISSNMGAVPRSIVMTSDAEVHDILSGEGYWSIAWAWVGTYLTSTAAQSVTVTYDWSYALDTLLACPIDCKALAQFSVGLANTAGSWTEMLTAKDGFVADGLWLRKTIDLRDIDSLSGSGTTSWTVSLPKGKYYLYAQVTSEGATVVPEPLTVLGVFAGVCGVGGYIRRRRK